jgi:hypothetical protein
MNSDYVKESIFVFILVLESTIEVNERSCLETETRQREENT